MKKISILLILILTTTLAACSSNTETNYEDSYTNQPKKVKNVEELYPQSIEYFKAVKELESIKDKDEATTFVDNFRSYILETYPYDYSQAKSDSNLFTLEDFGIIEKLLVQSAISFSSNSLLYEATNHTSTIGFNYYAQIENTKLPNRSYVITEDSNLRKEICPIDYNELKLHSFYEDILDSLEKNEKINIEKTIKDVKNNSANYEKKDIYNDYVISQINHEFSNDKERLLIICSSDESDIIGLTYNNFDSSNYETFTLVDNVITYTTSINNLNPFTQEELFNFVLGE